MSKQMCWLPIGGVDQEKVLHLRIEPNQSWQPYTAFPEYAVKDYDIPGGSKGYATYHQLRCQGWLLVSSLQ
ncbi:MAG: hypothetical protein F6K36_20155 [Symploca sp. SIO3C6]|uniref:Uncharacterized protein n=1 Tax=Symploca sp. SIO1C4 TaxID=2607765 RepID=A0A6B3N995_9CYAN|nr:hypothetical protein [Symploca sp. SIO3C6]NER28053.1 hypothetical protein [Symploca sp. SIO1C4]NET06746.1 hypothetical protein [Symploca sp. SIO2B6]NET54350.1 hypothetical protein [Merismopedia sp. SIO2A8]